MKSYRFLFLLLIAVLCWNLVCAKSGYGPGEQDWGFLDVRPGGHMFYWLYYTAADVANYTERPLALWLQGGPGASSTGRGNFEEFGPLDVHDNERNWTWVKDMNVLFIDNPLGSGFSYVDNITLLPSKNSEIAEDSLEFMKLFYERHREFEDVPLHIFSQSYGGKMAPEFALELYEAVQREEIRSNLKSVTLGSPWTSPMDSVFAWAPLMLNMGIIDKDGYNKIMEAVERISEYIENDEWNLAYKQWVNTSYIALNASENINFYNILKYLQEEDVNSEETTDNQQNNQTLYSLMNGPVKKALGIEEHIKWGSQKSDIFVELSSDFLKPVIDIVSELLSNTDVKVSVISGQLDLICATAGAVNWIEKLQWSYRKEYVSAPRNSIRIDNNIEGYEKSGGNFTMYWVNRAGHMIPADNPNAMSYILKQITNYG
ncbi:retinoid-inducible serine carboxypeptidase-like [Musca vetustissima]|uniref:retinoid-inducible serine carboxypeptidase-like n=1 Tax=Musca vetustissima TaxID=27455 RepID=UPI002AB60C9C|nr:retinoid-inducible serine carboxypeptidase-like [Musca vetustissima]